MPRKQAKRKTSSKTNPYKKPAFAGFASKEEAKAEAKKNPPRRKRKD